MSEPKPKSFFSTININFFVLAIVCLSLLFIYIANDRIFGDKNQWDFRVHYFSALTFGQGLNPYNNKDVNEVNYTGREIWAAHTYAYHPFTLYYFRVFNFFKYAAARNFYIAYNILLLILLLWIWKKFFLTNYVFPLAFVLFLIYANNKALIISLQSGNTALLEAFLLWAAFSFLIKNKSLLFLITLAIISLFKGTPLMLMPLVLLLPNKKQRLKELVIVIVLFFAVYSLPFFTKTFYFSDYWRYASNVREVTSINPCSYAFLTDLFKNKLLTNVAYVFWVFMVLFLYLKTILKANWESEKKLIIFLSFLTFAIIAPRFKDYAYIQLTPIAYILVLNNPEFILLNLWGLITQGIKLPHLISSYYPFLTAVAGWGYMLRSMLKKNKLRI